MTPNPVPSTFAPISLVWTRTEKDYVRAVLLHQSALKGQRFLGRILIPSIAAVLTIYWLVFGYDTLIVVFTTAFAVLSIVVLGMRFIAIPSHARRVFRQQKSLHEPLALDIDHRGLTARVGDVSHSSLSWDDCHRWVEGKLEFLIYPSDAIFYMVPKPLLEDTEITTLRQLLQSRVGAR